MAYYGIENINLNGTQKAALVAALQALGLHADPNPVNNNHWRVRLDGDAAIYHGNWSAEDWTIDAMRQRLGAIFGVSWVTIGTATATRSFSEGTSTRAVTFSRSGVDYLRMCEFGGVGATHENGSAEVRGYLRENAQAWGET